MNHLIPADLYSLEEYHRLRSDFRDRVIAHKRLRLVSLGENATLYFEDRLTIQYQVQEMLRIERIFESDAITEELDAYNPLIPSGTNLKATFMLEFPDESERRVALQQLVGIEDRTYVRVADLDRVYAIADEDLERSDSQKTSAVHFVRFEFTEAMIQALKNDATLRAGIDHDQYEVETLLSDDVRAALVADFD